MYANKSKSKLNKNSVFESLQNLNPKVEVNIIFKTSIFSQNTQDKTWQIQTAADSKCLENSSKLFQRNY